MAMKKKDSKRDSDGGTVHQKLLASAAEDREVFDTLVQFCEAEECGKAPAPQSGASSLAATDTTSHPRHNERHHALEHPYVPTYDSETDLRSHTLAPEKMQIVARSGDSNGSDRNIAVDESNCHFRRQPSPPSHSSRFVDDAAPQLTPTSPLRHMTIQARRTTPNSRSNFLRLPFQEPVASSANARDKNPAPSRKSATPQPQQQLVRKMGSDTAEGFLSTRRSNENKSVHLTTTPNPCESDAVMPEAGGLTSPSPLAEAKATVAPAASDATGTTGATAVQSTPLEHGQSDDEIGDHDSVILDDEIGPNDVILGRGAGPNASTGNVRFRHLVHRCFPAYSHPLCTKGMKTIIVRQVVNEITVRREGRFLEKCTTTNTTHQHDLCSKPRTVWKVVSQSCARRKVSQRFRQTKIDLTATTGRNAAINDIVPCLHFCPATDSWILVKNASGVKSRNSAAVNEVSEGRVEGWWS